ncbi:putative mitochondrial protein [Cucumis melo var. makuwa]|uniref:Mitochondrial protein n=1 Tax=Cucumis melo var. makuwa TaxID=1194695 RepID=A0A5D3BRH8_CUCMM|nr:putative mitochondrial protein [Cucumis melo var. makuwa]TYK01710.1 putative mitochondrial protein [Cucumis melo var. makuwa]
MIGLRQLFWKIWVSRTVLMGSLLTESKIDENEVVAKHIENETKSNHYGNTSKCDLSLDLSIALRKDLKKASPYLKKYTLDLLTEIDMLGCRHADTPIEFNFSLYKLPMRNTWKVYLRFCTFVWGNLVTWRCKKQSVVARSSAEVEYKAISLGICEKIWLQKVMSDLHQECEIPLKLFCDNKAAISIANNPVQHDRTKHVEIDRHFIKERLDNGSICIPYIPSSRQIADVLTKGLLRPNFDFCVNKLDLMDIYVPTQGGVLELVGLAH